MARASHSEPDCCSAWAPLSAPGLVASRASMLPRRCGGDARRIRAHRSSIRIRIRIRKWHYSGIRIIIRLEAMIGSRTGTWQTDAHADQQETRSSAATSPLAKRKNGGLHFCRPGSCQPTASFRTWDETSALQGLLLGPPGSCNAVLQHPGSQCTQRRHNSGPRGNQLRLLLF